VIKVTNEVRIYEIDGRETEGLNSPKVIVESHWNDDHWVRLRLEGEGAQAITVNANDLLTAIGNATNTHRHGL